MHFLSSFRRIHFHGYLKSPWNYIHDKKVTWSHHRSLSQLTPAFDFRSDTVTQPTSEMLQAMVRAPCGDDVYQEDPTVQLLERRVADLFGHEAALFVSSGTLSNQLGVRVHLPQPPSTVVCDARAHMYVAELGGLAFHSRAQVFPVTQWNEYFATYVASDPDWQAPTQLVCFENTLCGSVLELPNFQAWTSQAKQLGLKVHLDGARIWHAAVATQTSLHAYGALSDSVSVCFSKALGAPVGSCLIGPKDFIQKARRFRKLFGGAMRQVGFLAAACLYALDHHYPSMISKANENAKKLAQALQMHQLPYVTPVDTNMIFMDLASFKVPYSKLLETCLQNGVRVAAYSSQHLRLVTHGQLHPDAIGKLVKALHMCKNGATKVYDSI